MISLNLLPVEQKHQALLRQELSRWQPTMVSVMVGSLVVLLVSIFAGLLLEIHDGALRSQLQSQQTTGDQKVFQITSQIEGLNTTINDLGGKTATPRSWSRDLAAVLNILPTSISITKLQLSAKGEIQLEGIAQTRLAFLSLQSALTSAGILQNVTTTSTASKREDVPFVYHAQLR